MEASHSNSSSHANILEDGPDIDVPDEISDILDVLLKSLGDSGQRVRRICVF